MAMFKSLPGSCSPDVLRAPFLAKHGGGCCVVIGSQDAGAVKLSYSVVYDINRAALATGIQLQPVLCSCLIHFSDYQNSSFLLRQFQS